MTIDVKRKSEALMENIITDLINKINDLIQSEYSKEHFYQWLTISSDYDFMYIYELIFSENFKNYNYQTNTVLSYYAVNLSHALISFYEFNKIDLLQFVNLFIQNQFKNMTVEQLYLEKENIDV